MTFTSASCWDFFLYKTNETFWNLYMEQKCLILWPRVVVLRCWVLSSEVLRTVELQQQGGPDEKSNISQVLIFGTQECVGIQTCPKAGCVMVARRDQVL